jgi:hypothetical protein
MRELPWRWLAIAAIVALRGALLWRIFAPGETTGDDLSIHLAEIAQIARALRAGDPNLWNPTMRSRWARRWRWGLSRAGRPPPNGLTGGSPGTRVASAQRPVPCR